MKDAIVMKVKESGNTFELDVETDIDISSSTRFFIIDKLMRSLRVRVDWSEPREVESFAAIMFAVQEVFEEL